MPSKLNTVRDKLKSMWAAQLTTDGVTGVNLTTFHPFDKMAKTDVAYFHTIEASQSPLTFDVDGEVLVVNGVVHVLKPGVGDSVASDAEERALAIFASLERAIAADIKLEGLADNAEVESFTSDIDSSPEGIHCTLEFGIRVELCL